MDKFQMCLFLSENIMAEFDVLYRFNSTPSLFYFITDTRFDPGITQGELVHIDFNDKVTANLTSNIADFYKTGNFLNEKVFYIYAQTTNKKGEVDILSYIGYFEVIGYDGTFYDVHGNVVFKFNLYFFR